MADQPLVSVVIPVWRDVDVLAASLGRLSPAPAGVEVIVASVLGDESRYDDLRTGYPHVHWISAPRGRAVQMNAGAAVATGRWLLFLHTDCTLPDRWAEVIVQADAAAASAGAFRFKLDTPDWRARLIEAGVRLRVALLGLPYGDQALFVRREVFHGVGGYRDVPLMEDIDFVRRVRKAGPLLRAREPVLTSARRWQHDGWLCRTAQNIGLASRFLLGTPPARLAQRYYGRHESAVVMMARAPWTGGKTRLGVAVPPSAYADLRHALFLDTLDVVVSIEDAEHIVACEPAGACERMRGWIGTGADVIAQRGERLGERMAHTFEDVFRLGVESVVIVGSDLPDLPARLVREALSVIRASRDAVVLGPASDGGYYLIAMSRPHPILFNRIDWGTDHVLAQTLEGARTAGIPVHLLESWADVDRPDDISRLVDTATGAAARRTRAWSVAHAAPRLEAGVVTIRPPRHARTPHGP
ncbi:MAG: TIGR04283 family arsenosugar biosynthesis glycosyltransferase [Acidobacteria bacterium]|nr:TIGR04283 family arsenosugar biosynthesis glycosyltransferase [Acidobacteriota bacterium]